MKRVGVGVGTWTISLPTEQPRLIMKPINIIVTRRERRFSVGELRFLSFDKERLILKTHSARSSIGYDISSTLFLLKDNKVPDPLAGVG